MAISEQQIQSALKQIIDPTTGKDYISTQSVRNIQIDQQHVSIDIELGYPANSVKQAIQKQITDALHAIPGIEKIQVSVNSKMSYKIDCNYSESLNP